MTDAPRTTIDSQIIADQERTIARLRSEVELLEHHDRELEEAIVERFNPPDDDSSTTYTVLEHVADLVEAQPCACPAGAGEDEEPCWRCQALGRVNDEAIAR